MSHPSAQSHDNKKYSTLDRAIASQKPPPYHVRWFIAFIYL